MGNTRQEFIAKSQIGKPDKVVTKDIFNGWKSIFFKGRKFKNKGYILGAPVTSTHLDDEALREKQAAINPAAAKAEKENADLKRQLAEAQAALAAAKKPTKEEKKEDKKETKKEAVKPAKGENKAVKEDKIP